MPGSGWALQAAAAAAEAAGAAEQTREVGPTGRRRSLRAGRARQGGARRQQRATRSPHSSPLEPAPPRLCRTPVPEKRPGSRSRAKGGRREGRLGLPRPDGSSSRPGIGRTEQSEAPPSRLQPSESGGRGKRFLPLQSPRPPQPRPGPGGRTGPFLRGLRKGAQPRRRRRMQPRRRPGEKALLTGEERRGGSCRRRGSRGPWRSRANGRLPFRCSLQPAQPTRTRFYNLTRNWP